MTPYRATLLVRLFLAAGSAVLAVLMLGPFQELENAIPVSDKVLHGAAFYILASMLFIALPRNRRLDIAFGLLAIAGSSELLQGLAGRDADVMDFLADGVGIYMAVAPIWVEKLRSLTRENPHGDLAGLWTEGDRRRSAPARAPAAAKTMYVPKGTKPWTAAYAPAKAPVFNPDGR